MASRCVPASCRSGAAVGHQITTIEGLSPTQTHPLQLAWVAEDVPQCGYCQSGQIMSAAALLNTGAAVTDDSIRNAMSGNLCRCGTYGRINKAIKRAAAASEGGLMDLARRTFLKQSATLASGLAVAFYLPPSLAGTDPKAPAAASEFEPNAWVRIFADGTVKLVVHKHDSGTGTHTALAACVAEELDVNPMTVQVISPKTRSSRPTFTRCGRCFPPAVLSVSLEYDRLRLAGATARALLVAAAARQWQVGRPVAAPPRSDAARQRPTQPGLRRAGGGGRAFADARTRQSQGPGDQFKYIGKLRHKRDAAAKVCGAFQYSLDLRLPQMLVALLQRTPVVGARVLDFDARAALQVPGVRKVLAIPGY